MFSQETSCKKQNNIISKKDFSFVNEFWARVEKKVAFMASQIGAEFPWTDYNTERFFPSGGAITGWTAGFWPGMMWLMYLACGDERYRKIAEECEEKLDSAFAMYRDLSHDVGFVWINTSVANYKITGNERSRDRAIHAASLLASRFNHRANYIRAWDNINDDSLSWAIIDSMMNIPILCFASAVTRDPRFKYIAEAHADMTMNNFVRPDGSVRHVVSIDPETGKASPPPTWVGQGYSYESSWTRGQGWAIYGFVHMYLNTGRADYLDTARRIAHYFISNIDETGVPLADFRAPDFPVCRDTSASGVTACGLIEIAKIVPEHERAIYTNAAIKLLRGLDENCNYGEDTVSLLQNGAAMYTADGPHPLPYIYGDYYMLEAIMKLRGNEINFSQEN